MSDQSDNPVIQEQIEGQTSLARTATGQFAPGHSGNPKGGSNRKGWQPFGQRAIILGERYTSAQIREWGQNDDLRNSLFSYWDGLCILAMARAMDRDLTKTDSGADQVHKERRELLDRIEGTPVQTIRTGALQPIKAEDIENMSPAEIDRLYRQTMKS